MQDWIVLGLYAAPAIAIYVIYLSKYGARESANHAVLEESIEANLMIPPSLHPVINHDRCIGCEACVRACPEFPAHKVLGIIRGKSHLISPTDCIGHGACKTVCPVDAISLVFGTSERGVDIPNLSKEFETNVPGIYIAGELGGMGLIRNAVEQGCQALDNIAASLRGSRHKNDYDVGIVGAGPAGFAATLSAAEKGLKYVTIEQSSLGGTVANFPRGKIVMTKPVRLPMYGMMQFKETQKEDLIDFWQGVADETQIRIEYGEKLEKIVRSTNGFRLITNSREYTVAKVLLTLGRRGTPRKLDVAGEDLPKVVYSMIDPAEYAGKRVCVVGGGDSALEAAHTIAMEPGAQVALSYRSAAFTRAKKRNRMLIEQRVKEGRLRVEMNSNVREIREDSVVLERQSATGDNLIEILPNDAVIVCVGGILPTSFLESVGVEVETKYGTA